VTLRDGSLAATFLPGAGMLGVSLRHGDDELLAHTVPLARARTGATTGFGIVHPWANRLGSRSYRAGRRTVTLEGIALPTDGRDLPIHGNLFGAPFQVEHLDARHLRASFDYGADAGRRRAFPFPHILTIDVALHDARMRVVTSVAPTSRAAVPISFGWHPYFRLPATPRREWSLRLPAGWELELDHRMLPTGGRRRVPARTSALGATALDHHFALGTDRRFVLAGTTQRLTVTFGRAYPFAQVFAPARRPFVAIEPMTAPIDALRSGSPAQCRPGERFHARFEVEVERA
jgi:galactose mutarotase-like enzyme